MKLNVWFGVVVVAELLSLMPSHGQGTIQWNVTFDRAPYIGPNDIIGYTYYSERAMEFTPIGAGWFTRSGGQPAQTAFPRNGSAYLMGAFGDSLAVGALGGSRFGAVSVELAEFSTLYQEPLTVRFVGYRPDGSTVTTDFVTDGIIDGAGPARDFETFYFDQRFADVFRIEVPTYGWSLDNMVFSSVIPEPGTGGLLVMGVALALFRRQTSTTKR